MTQTSRTIGIINGSVRHGGNTAGVVAWVETILTKQETSDGSAPSISFDIIDLTSSPGHPLPLAIASTIPAAITPPAYPDPLVQTWSKTVSGWDAVIIVTPQYNWGIPGILKNSLDHLYHEWRAMPVGIVTLGGHGGGKCADALRTVCAGGLKMKVAEKGVGVTLPGEYIRGGEKVKGEEEWLKEYEGALVEMLDEIQGVVKDTK